MSGLPKGYESYCKNSKKCGCPGGSENCVPGYFKTFNNLYDEKKNPIDESIVLSGYKGKNCGTISGIIPGAPWWDEKKFRNCVKFHDLHTNVNKELRKLKPINNIFNRIDGKKMETYANPDEIKEDVRKRALSFNKQLKKRTKGSSSFLDGQLQSTELIRRSNTEWKNMMDTFEETDEKIKANMQVKQRLAEINNEEVRDKNNTIMVILGSFSSLLIGVFALVGNLSNVITTQTMFLLFLIGIIVFFIFSVGLNKYALQNFEKLSRKLKKEIIHKGDKLNLATLQWVDDNCDCSDEKESKINDDNIYYNDGVTNSKINVEDFSREMGYSFEELQDNKM